MGEAITSLAGPVLGFAGLVVVALIGAYATIKTNSKEKTAAADTSIDKTLASELVLSGQRLLLKDEHIDFLETRLEDSERRNESKIRRIKMLEAENATLKTELNRERELNNGRDS